MKSKILLTMNTTKKKAGVALLCGALVATIGAGTVFAANDSATMLRKIEDGVTIYSTDGGQTWSENAPEGVTEFNGKEGSRGFIRGMGFNGEFNDGTGYMMKSKDGAGYMVKVEDGTKLYSIDGGETWSENAPEGMPAFNGKEGTVIRGTGPNDGTGYMMKTRDGTGYMVKIENETKLYSTDGGETWSENVPEGVLALNGKEGTVFRGMGPSDGTGYEMKIRDAAEVI
ncbi:BNR/Asp-box repeat-containing protein [Anaerovirgula multivorans]|uniref:BNR/Asp-box repeat-containing protein n=1 Tax=Anaerovirgula multivorans TaxID=312168 RepID=A0A239IIK2_9FIRM|nr:sialidase family protein [Anaerovirgula multivorans]SNS93232.1 BNR/Asp-box repeat-containing protein [Anaerovirgula multivorans]